MKNKFKRSNNELYIGLETTSLILLLSIIISFLKN